MKLTLPFIILLGISVVGAQSSTPTLIDEFGNVPCEDWVGRLDLFLAELHNHPASKGVIVLYEGKYWNYAKEALVWPIFGEVHIRARMIRDHFSHRGYYDHKRVVFITGGIRDEHYIGLWLVPSGATFPKPKPTRETIRYRKGKATTIYPTCP